MNLAEGGVAEVFVGVILAPARERDLAGVPAQVAAPLGEDRCERLAVERHEDGGVLVARRVHGRRLFGCQEVLLHAPIIRMWLERS